MNIPKFNRTLLTLSLFLLAQTFSACSQFATRTFDLRDFDRLDIASSVDVEIKQGSFFSIIAEGRSKDLDDLEAKVKDGTLKVRRSDNGFHFNLGWKNRDVKMVITMPTIKGLTLSGSSDGVLQPFKNLKELQIELSGASDLMGSFADVDKINLHASGSSDGKFKGTARELVAQLSGASDLKAYDLQLKSATIHTSGASDAHLSVSDKLDVEANGASDVHYRGNPSVRQKTSGSSDVVGH